MYRKIIQLGEVLVGLCRRVADLPDDTLPIQADPALWIPARLPILLPANTCRVVCEAGTVWITQGDGDDYILHAGQSLVLRPKEQPLLNAMFAPALVRCVTKRAARQPVPPFQAKRLAYASRC